MITVAQGKRVEVLFERHLNSVLSIGITLEWKLPVAESGSTAVKGYGATRIGEEAETETLETRALKYIIDDFKAKQIAFTRINAGSAVFLISKTVDLSGKNNLRITEDNSGNTYYPLALPVPVADVLTALRLSYGGVCQAIVAAAQQ